MRVCEFEGCGRKHEAKGLCHKHYGQMRDRGFLGVRPLRVCEFDGCGQVHMAKGLCRGHYRQSARGVPLTPTDTRPRRVCTVEGCGQVHSAKGLCHKHYVQTRPAKPRNTTNNTKKCSREQCDTCEDVAWLQASGETETHIAGRLGLSVSTVRNHTKTAAREGVRV